MSNPYKLPDGNVLISFSGGRTSGYMLHKILEANGELPERCKVVFANTGREMPETLDFVQRCSDEWNVHVDWLEYKRKDGKVSYEKVSHNMASRNGEPFRELCVSRSYLPNAVTRFCTEELKVKTIKRFLSRNGWKRWFNTVGIRVDEAHRLRLSKDSRWVNWYPLADAKVTHNDVVSFWKENKFDLAVKKGFGNCDGCFLKSEATIAAGWRDYPERMKWWKDMEDEIGSTFHKSRSYHQVGEFVDKQGDWIFDDEALLCQSDDGECTGDL